MNNTLFITAMSILCLIIVAMLMTILRLSRDRDEAWKIQGRGALKIQSLQRQLDEERIENRRLQSLRADQIRRSAPMAPPAPRQERRSGASRSFSPNPAPTPDVIASHAFWAATAASEPTCAPGPGYDSSSSSDSGSCSSSSFSSSD